MASVFKSKGQKPSFLKRIPLPGSYPKNDGRYAVELELKRQIGFKLSYDSTQIFSMDFKNGLFLNSNPNLKVSAWYKPIYTTIPQPTKSVNNE